MEGKQRHSTPGENFTPRAQISLLGYNFDPGGSKFAPRGEVKNGPLVVPGVFISNFKLIYF
jgi:hypothetical protein